MVGFVDWCMGGTAVSGPSKHELVWGWRLSALFCVALCTVCLLHLSKNTTIQHTFYQSSSSEFFCCPTQRKNKSIYCNLQQQTNSVLLGYGVVCHNSFDLSVHVTEEDTQYLRYIRWVYHSSQSYIYIYSTYIKLYCAIEDFRNSKRVIVISMFLVDSCDVFTLGLIDLVTQPLAAQHEEM